MIMDDLQGTIIVLVVVAIACWLIIFGYQMSNRNEESTPTWYTRMIAPIIFVLLICIIGIFVVALVGLMKNC